MKAKKEYFNLYVEYDSSTVSYNEVFDTLAIKLANKELTPRQIRILIYRYLLAWNL